MNNDNCNGVFAPVCSPQVCDVPRIPYEQTLMEGMGYIDNRMSSFGCAKVQFKIRVYRRLYDVFGKLCVLDEYGRILIYSEQMEAYHSPKEDAMVAIFHYEDSRSHHAREISVYASVGTANQPAKFYMYSAPLSDDEVQFGGIVRSGMIKIEKSLVDHEH